MLRSITLALATTLALANPVSAQTALPPTCTKIETLRPADGGFGTVGIRRPVPKDAPVFSTILVEVQQAPALARVDIVDGGTSFVVAAEACGDSVIRYHVRVVREGDNDTFELPIAKSAGAVKIRSCSAAAKVCYEGAFGGDFLKGVTLIASPGSGPAPVLKKGYSF